MTVVKLSKDFKKLTYSVYLDKKIKKIRKRLESSNKSLDRILDGEYSGNYYWKIDHEYGLIISVESKSINSELILTIEELVYQYK